MKVENMLMLLLGAGVLLPWNAMLTAADWMIFLYSPFPFMFVVGLFYNIPNAASLFVSIFVGRHLPSYGTRLVVGFAVDLVVLILIPLTAILIPSHTLSRWVVLFITSFAGAASAIIFGAGMGLASKFGGPAISAFMTGNGISGLIVMVLRLITKVFFAPDESGYRISALLYFISAALFIAICIAGSIYLVRLPSASADSSSSPSMEEEKKSLIEDNTSAAGNVQESQCGPATASLATVFKKLWMQSFNVAAVFFVTLSLFPGVVTMVRYYPSADNSMSSTDDDGLTWSLQSKTNNNAGWLTEWYSLILIDLFMVGDFLGRFATGFKQLNAFVAPKLLMVPVLLRLLFFPGFIILVKYYIWGNPMWGVLVMVLFSLSNGYFGTLGMIYGPQSASTNEQEAAANIMSFSLNFGIILGNTWALFVLYFINGKFSL